MSSCSPRRTSSRSWTCSGERAALHCSTRQTCSLTESRFFLALRALAGAAWAHRLPCRRRGRSKYVPAAVPLLFHSSMPLAPLACAIIGHSLWHLCHLCHSRGLLGRLLGH